MSQPNKLSLSCHWNTCHSAPFDDVVVLMQHVVEHAKKECRLNEDKQTCCWSSCSETFDSKNSFTLHVSFHGYHSQLLKWGSIVLEETKNKYPNLSDCGQDASSRFILPALPDVFRCSWKDCLGEFLDPQSFYRHTDTHAMEDTIIPAISKDELKVTRFAKCLWEGCGQSFKSKTILRIHLKKHTQEKSVACPTCGTMFYDKQKFRDHVLRQFDKESDAVDDSMLKCPECDRVFLSKRLLDEHASRHNKIVYCDLCSFKANCDTAIERHKKYVHSNERPFKCPFCSHGFKSRYDLRKHLFVHDEEERFKCDFCNFSCRTSDSLGNHTRKHHQEQEPPKFQCHISGCNQLFTRGNNLSRHLLRTHNISKQEGESRFTFSLDSNGVYRLQR
jgi:uncharacterized Zn-finger protein